MLQLVYTKNQDLENKLNIIETLRRRLLLCPISPKTELRWRWEAMAQRICFSFLLNGYQFSKKETLQILSGQKKGRISHLEKKILNYQKAFNFIRESWTLNTKPVTPKTILDLEEILSAGVKPSFSKNDFKKIENYLKQLLNYLDGQNENPVIQAAIAQSQLALLDPEDQNISLISKLSAYLFLYKKGYDFRNFLVLEEYWQNNPKSFENYLQSIEKDGNSNRWLFYYTQGMISQLKKIHNRLHQASFSFETPSSFFSLNDRQKEILNNLEQPDLNITNKKIQKMFGVSQITASRDLRKLASLGLLFPHGKGRSVFYTKV